MARIRTIKPEFWDSPDTAKAGPWARLLFIALWNWADDYGRGTANMKELEGFAFPNDDKFTDMHGNTVQFRDVAAEVSDCFGVMFYEVSGRPYYAIPSWEEHQRNERRAKQSKYPSPEVRDPVAEIPCNRAEDPNISGPGTGEEGNRGRGEQLEAIPESRPKKKQPSPDEKHINEVTSTAYEAIGKAANWNGLRAIAKWCVKERGLTLEQFRDACVWIYETGKPITKQTMGQQLDGHFNRPSERGPARNRADERTGQARAVIDQLRTIEEHYEPTQGELL